MPRHSNLTSGYTLITGASSGIGAEFARQFAARGHNLILVARRKNKMEELRSELLAGFAGSPMPDRAMTPPDIRVIDCDLAAITAPGEPRPAEKLFRQTEAEGLRVTTLVNNAGFGSFDDFAASPLSRYRQMIELNVSALTELAHLYLGPMRQSGRGAILNIASVAAYFPGPYFAVYAATKSFVLSLSQALYVENTKSGVHVMAVCPGSTETNFFEVAEMQAIGGKSRMMTSAQVVSQALSALDSRQPVVVTGSANKALTIAARFIPTAVLLGAGGLVMRMAFRRHQRELGRVAAVRG